MGDIVKIFYKKVLMPIEVTYGDYCQGNGRICGHFDNEGGYPSCDLGFHLPERDDKGQTPKPKECMELEDIK